MAPWVRKRVERGCTTRSELTCSQRTQTPHAGDAPLDRVQPFADSPLESVSLFYRGCAEELPLYSVAAERETTVGQAVDK